MKYNILLTNDDGIASPLVEPFLVAISKSEICQQLLAVFPSEEQSWISQALTRFRPIYVTETRIQDQKVFLASGTPADCVGLGLNNLSSAPIDYVISGINVGTNASLPFYLNSGTVGAARQACCFDVKAIAFSVLVPEDIFRLWREEDQEVVLRHVSDWERIASVCVRISEKLLSPECWQGIDLFSINMPWEVTNDTEVTLTGLERKKYLPLYQDQGNGKYLHHFQGFSDLPLSPAKKGKERDLEGDVTALASGKISICPISYNLQPDLSVKTQILDAIR